MKLLTSIWVVLLVAIGLFYIRVQDPIPIQMLRLKTFDALQLRQEVDKSEDIALINIGYESLKALGQFPWPRTHFAQYAYISRALTTSRDRIGPKKLRAGSERRSPAAAPRVLVHLVVRLAVHEPRAVVLLGAVDALHGEAESGRPLGGVLARVGGEDGR